ncbi:hypothetical protein [Parahaliea mediterranea]|uniref:Uncharacterized protein n=1 Tax=Parahaliea mediterranea TaxID=651086 RepID=A0A939IKM1_9GAMM|nr:hypothetical protein [Parahaliea mediterranea]MBN7795078.1 hypothetical protein [Parahaliea mediterranea]
MPVAQARDALHWRAGDGGLLSASYRWLSSTRLDAGVGEVRGRRTDLVAQWDSEGGLVAGLGHEYSALDVRVTPERAAPVTNGDLHTLYAVVSWDRALENAALSLAFAPALSASSNAFSEPGELNGDSVQVWASAMALFPASRGEWVLGAARDHRFGEATIYPVVGWRLRTESWRVRLVYPDLLLQRELGRHWALGLTLAPDGNEWQAFDANLAWEGAFAREAWQAELQFSRRWGQRLETALTAASVWDQHWRYVARGGQRLDVGSDDSYTVGVQVRWRLGGTTMK